VTQESNSTQKRKNIYFKKDNDGASGPFKVTVLFTRISKLLHDSLPTPPVCAKPPTQLHAEEKDKNTICKECGH
jgi:hypothetical protein